MEEKYNWEGTVSAPQEYPMEIYDGAIIANDYTYNFDSIWGTQNTGWGNEGGVMSDSSNSTEIPYKLEFTWLSIVENKFYTGKWVLDKEKISQLFREGVINRLSGKKSTYSQFKVGLAPRGKVVLWLNGEGYQKEIGVFQAHDTIIKKDDAYENAQYMFEPEYIKKILTDPSFKTFKSDVKNRINNYGYPNPSIYEVFREKYNWNPKIKLPDGYLIDSNGSILFCNGEQDDFANAQKKPIPYFMTFTFTDKNGKKYGIDIVFTKVEDYRKEYILKGNTTIPTDFELNEINKIFNDSRGEKIDFILDINPQNNQVQIVLKYGEKTHILKEFKSIIWQI